VLRDRRAAPTLTPRTTERLTIDGPAGPLEVVLNLPPASTGGLRGIALVLHPHPLQGGTLDNKVAQTLAKTFFALGYASVRPNFRGVGKSAGSFAEGVGETDDALAALGWAQRRLGNARPVVLAGFSFGSYVQTRVAHSVAAERMVLVGPAVGRFALATVPPDTIVIHGEEDDVVPLAAVLEWARPQELPLIVFPGCGHFFHGRLPQLQRVITAMWQPSHAPVLGA
jgi:alpha/beta superfamily hydrolase